MKDLLRAIEEAAAWLDLDGVEMVAPGKQSGRDCIDVGCSGPLDELAGQIPKTFHGYPVVLKDSGTITALDSKNSRK